MRAFPRRGQRGFTLIEVLVVMLLVGMIVTVLFQGLSQSIRIRATAGAQTAQLGRESMRRTWYRQLVNGLVPDDDKGTARFEGGPKSFKGQSTNPVDIDTGVVLPITVSLDQDITANTTVVNVTTDSVAGGPHTIALLSLPGLNHAFAYVDADGTQSASWPRREIVKPPQLPTAIWIVDGSDNHATELLTASVIGRRDVPPRVATLLDATQ